ncbi:RNA polymerase sigma factor [Micromonospora olivasterospora]|uniref:RNA polymerase sigma-70 factor (ECF subfamily) n=1 Tax=Micromonospora olivasterospora TaxID=1880 RepID=A0A562HV64_MICOL|nr:sigma factor-like helix-turn-helix DNA-binding protein [Micromonospora olivasterospora]TWH62305.1 RNA polymerase sigma-70 factor (ECF subfamily) [Micromonospora olivasterospora]
MIKRLIVIEVGPQSRWTGTVSVIPAATAGLSPGTLYNHIPDLRELRAAGRALVLANEARGRRRWRELTLRVAAEPDQSVAADHADEVISQRDVAVAFDQVLEADREVLRLVAWERLTVAEAAVVLGCSRATFAMRLMRARRRLRTRLGVVGVEAGQAPQTAPSMSNGGR